MSSEFGIDQSSSARNAEKFPKRFKTPYQRIKRDITDLLQTGRSIIRTVFTTIEQDADSIRAYEREVWNPITKGEVAQKLTPTDMAAKKVLSTMPDSFDSLLAKL